MIKTFIDLSGKRFGSCVALHRDNSQEFPVGDRNRWICKCDCGKEFSTRANSLRTGNTRSCGHLWHASGPDSAGWKGTGEIGSRRFWLIKKGAEKRGIEFSITIEQAWNVYIQQKGICALTGDSISFRERTASLDRIDNTKGYVDGNIQWVHKVVNKLKGCFPENELLGWCEKIVKHLKYDNQTKSKKNWLNADVTEWYVVWNRKNSPVYTKVDAKQYFDVHSGTWSDKIIPGCLIATYTEAKSISKANNGVKGIDGVDRVRVDNRGIAKVEGI